MPTLPPLVTMKFVAVEEPMTKLGPVMPFGLIDRRPHGEVVPMPRNPAEVKVLVAVPPNHASYAENFVEEAPLLKSRSDVVALCVAVG